MSEYNDKIKKEIDNFFYTDISTIIKDYLYVECVECKIQKQVCNIFDGVKDTFYCAECKYLDHIRECCLCKKLYSIKDYYHFCGICLTGCRVKCRKCYIEDRDNNEELEIISSRNYHMTYYWLEFQNNS